MQTTTKRWFCRENLLSTLPTDPPPPSQFVCIYHSLWLPRVTLETQCTVKIRNVLHSIATAVGTDLLTCLFEYKNKHNRYHSPMPPIKKFTRTRNQWLRGLMI